MKSGGPEKVKLTTRVPGFRRACNCWFSSRRMLSSRTARSWSFLCLTLSWTQRTSETRVKDRHWTPVDKDSHTSRSLMICLLKSAIIEVWEFNWCGGSSSSDISMTSLGSVTAFWGCLFCFVSSFRFTVNGIVVSQSSDKERLSELQAPRGGLGVVGLYDSNLGAVLRARVAGIGDRWQEKMPKLKLKLSFSGRELAPEYRNRYLFFPVIYQSGTFSSNSITPESSIWIYLHYTTPSSVWRSITTPVILRILSRAISG